MADAGPAPGPTPEQLAFAARILFVEQVYFCSMYAVVVWDWLSSLTREYRLIWRKSWTPVKCIYLFCRYWARLSHLPPFASLTLVQKPVCIVPYTLWVYTVNHDIKTCNKNFIVVPLLMTFNMASAELVLLIRTYAFLGRKTWMLGGLLATLAGVFIYQYWAVITQMILLPLGPEAPCFPVAKAGSKHVMGFFVAPLLFDSLVTGLTLWKAFSMRYRFTKSASESTSFVRTFVNEGLGYFVLISIANLLNGAFYLQPIAVLQALNIPLSIMFPNILACRLILTLRSRGSNSDLHLSTSSPPSGGSARSGLAALHSGSAAQQVTFGGTGAKRNTLGQTETLAMSHLATHGADEDSMYVEKLGRDEEEAFSAVPVRVSVVGATADDDAAFTHVATLADGQMTPRARRAATNGVQVHVERMNS
ncbi:hypothetical protein AURDEDRAFT_159112 [Auricularia subglabra TFB-10046 SS5]|nr:hypothetical protein AURDEDRAFT_159112 [Auricularia subglabra TFB-10046 SS5]